MWVHTEGKEVQKNLDVTLRLHKAAHDAEDGVETIVLGDEGGDDCVVWPFVWSEEIRMCLWGKGKAAAPVLEDEASVRGDNAGAEAAEEGAVGVLVMVVKKEEREGGLDEAAAVAVGVGNREVDGVAGAKGGSAVVEGGIGGRSIKGGGARGEVVLVGGVLVVRVILCDLGGGGKGALCPGALRWGRLRRRGRKSTSGRRKRRCGETR